MFCYCIRCRLSVEQKCCRYHMLYTYSINLSVHNCSYISSGNYCYHIPGGPKSGTFMRHEVLVLRVKKMLKSVYIYGSHRKNRTGVPLFGPLCTTLLLIAVLDSLIIIYNVIKRWILFTFWLNAFVIPLLFTYVHNVDYYKKAVLSQRRPRDAPYISLPWKFSTVSKYVHGYFSRNF